MTREELQRLYDDCQDGRYGHLVALVEGVRRFLAEPDPTVEIAYLKATLADVKAEREAAQENARTAWAVHSEHTDRTGVIIAAHVRDAVFATTRAEKAEAAIERLARWKAEALPVMAGLQELGEALGVPLGQRITGEEAAEAATALAARAEAAEQAIQRVRSQCDFWSHGNSWNRAARNAILRALDGGA